MTQKKYKVLFLGRDNSARSIMAEALLRELAGHRFEAFSAGAKPAARVHSLAMAQLRPGISDLGRLNPKSWLDFTGEWAPRMDVVIAMGDPVAEYHAPVFPGRPECCQWNIPDPLAEGMTDAERARLFKRAFWQILRRVNLFISLPQPSAAAPIRTVGTEPSRMESPFGSNMRLDVGGCPSLLVHQCSDACKEQSTTASQLVRQLVPATSSLPPIRSSVGMGPLRS